MTPLFINFNNNRVKELIKLFSNGTFYYLIVKDRHIILYGGLYIITK